jgi:hypothetical protein
VAGFQNVLLTPQTEDPAATAVLAWVRAQVREAAGL